MTSRIEEALQRLVAHYGRRRREAAENPFDALLAAALGANAADRRVALAIENLREAGVTDARGLVESSPDELIEWLGPAGNARQKAGRLLKLARFIVERYDGSIEALFSLDTEALRGELLSLQGIGARTADSILLFAGRRPELVVDLATHRVLKRHGWIEFEADGEAIKESVEAALSRDPGRLAEFHDLLDVVGRQHCRKAPLCDGCPLAELLPAGGPLAPEF
ncbi:MAG TPA: endonuclease III domain-containing protein [Pirellulales bacterium]|nr:endonuclease III domain-containing protein [Pirellulales bacterium]